MAGMVSMLTGLARRGEGRRNGSPRRWARRLGLLGGVAALLLASHTTASTAQERLLIIGEGTTACPRGYLCAWPESDFRGRGVAIFGSESDWRLFPPPFDIIDNRASSFFNNGFSDEQADVRLGREFSLNSGTFVLCNGDAIPDLGPGRDDGQNPGLTWNDAVTSNQRFSSFWC
jgi:hypothetical protein